MEKKNYSKIIFLSFICTLFTSAGQLFLKLGAEKFELSFVGIITNSFLILGCTSYIIGALLMVMALKHGELSVVYPFISLSFIWVALLSTGFLAEHIALLQWLGIAAIICGVSFVGWGAKHA